MHGQYELYHLGWHDATVVVLSIGWSSSCWVHPTGEAQDNKSYKGLQFMFQTHLSRIVIVDNQIDWSLPILILPTSLCGSLSYNYQSLGDMEELFTGQTMFQALLKGESNIMLLKNARVRSCWLASWKVATTR